jgi:hypothetical protein
MRFLKRFFCRHDYAFVRNMFGDEIINWGWKRSAWKCVHCGKWQGRDYLQKDNQGNVA